MGEEGSFLGGGNVPGVEERHEATTLGARQRHNGDLGGTVGRVIGRGGGAAQ